MLNIKLLIRKVKLFITSKQFRKEFKEFRIKIKQETVVFLTKEFDSLKKAAKRG